MHKFFAFSIIRLPSVNSDFHKPGVSEGGTLMTLRVEESMRKGVKAWITFYWYRCLSHFCHVIQIMLAREILVTPTEKTGRSNLETGILQTLFRTSD